MKVRSNPQKGKPLYARTMEAWWYEGRNSIDVLVRGHDGNVLVCRIHRRHLKDWIKRTEPR